MSQPDLIKLHLGAFNCALNGWVNTDITPHIWVARVPFAAQLLRAVGRMTQDRLEEHKRGQFSRLKYMDLTRPLPFADGSVSAVFSSHVFEHLFLDEVERLVAEIYRILAPGGVCRVVVPNLSDVVALYDPEDPKPFLEAMFEIGRRSDIKNAHHSGFTPQSMSKLFASKGFRKTSVLSYRRGECPDIDKLDNRPESLFFEAVR